MQSAAKYRIYFFWFFGENWQVAVPNGANRRFSSFGRAREFVWNRLRAA